MREFDRFFFTKHRSRMCFVVFRDSGNILSLFFILGCSHVNKSIWGTPIGEIKMKGITESDCEVECKVYEYDDNFIELLDGYEHPLVYMYDTMYAY